MPTCYFTGHRTVYDGDRVYALLEAEIARHITQYGVDTFYVGNYGQFDHMAQRALVVAKNRYPHILAQIALAYHPGLRPVRCPQGLDGTYFPPGQERTPPKFAIVELNQAMIRLSTHLIAYVYTATSGSWNLLQYAQGRERRGQLQIANLADPQGQSASP